MKKFLSLVCVIGTLFALTACGSFTCGICEQEKSGKKHEVEESGVSVTLCDDCYKEYQDALEEFGY